MDPKPEAIEKLQDAYRALGSAVADLRSMPVRNYARDEEEYRVAGATRSIGEAEGLTRQACEALGRSSPRWAIEVNALGGLRGIARPAVWEWIGQLHEARGELAAILGELGAAVPDDLPEGSPMEQLASSPQGRAIGTIAFAVVLAGLIIAAVVTGLMGS